MRMHDTLIEIIEKEEYPGFALEIHSDQDAESPRSWDNVGTMWIDAILKEENLPHSSNWKYYYEKEHEIRLNYRAINMFGGVAIPIQFGDYGSNGQYCHDCDWDNANGLYWCEEEEMLHKHGFEDRRQCHRALISEISTYNSYLQGEVYGFVVVNTSTKESGDSCWGFIGDREYCEQEGLAALKNAYDHLQSLSHLKLH